MLHQLEIASRENTSPFGCPPGNFPGSSRAATFALAAVSAPDRFLPLHERSNDPPLYPSRDSCASCSGPSAIL